MALFQTGWFVESMWTQTLVIHMLRTEKLPFVQSRASVPVALLSLAGIALVTAIPFTPLAAPLEMAALPPVYFLLLGILVAGYMLLVTAVKTCTCAGMANGCKPAASSRGRGCCLPRLFLRKKMAAVDFFRKTRYAYTSC